MFSGLLPSRALALTLVLAGAGCDTPAAHGEASLASEFDQARAWRNLERIVALGARPSGTLKLEEQIKLLEAELTSFGLKPVRETFQERTPIGSLTFINLYAEIEGEAKDGAEPPIAILCTHIDTKRMSFEFVGANDAGSGTAVLLELARVLAGTKGPVTWRLLFLDGEESILPEWRDPDNRYGSRHHVAKLKESGLKERVKACILLDLVGDKDLRFLTELNSDPRLRKIFFDAAERNGLGPYVNGKKQEINDDHLSFLAAGIPSVDLIDFEYGPSNKFWHSPDDTLANCSPESLGATGRIVLHGLPGIEAWIAGEQ